MSSFLYFILGLIQGLTEFLPVSSSGHLAIIQTFFSGVQKESLLIEITAHLGSLFAIVVYYRSELLKQLKGAGELSINRLYPLVILFISTLPAGLAGLFLKDNITHLFSNTKVIAAGFLFTSFALIFTYLFSKKSTSKELLDWPTPGGALFIGFAQALALLPGISRSGSTIAAGVLMGLKPKQSAFFSFCSVAPLISAAALLSVYKLISHAERLTQSENPLNLSVLLISSFFFGWLGLSLVVRFLEKNKLHYFALYLVPLASLLLIWG
ncbi:MAG: undecaprenyl-diphosphate phosphatase [Bdellovibrionales bacterium]